MAEHPAIAAGLTVGGFALFKGYSAPLADGAVATLNEGDAVKIIRFEDDADVIVTLVDDDGNEVMRDGKAVAERCFP